MLSGKTIKLLLFEILEFTAFVAPVFVVLERFAGLIFSINNDGTTYWLIVAVSIAYVTSVTLLAWVPLEYMVLKRRRFIVEISQWRPTVLIYLILSTAPCFGIIIASATVQMMETGQTQERFTELPVSLVLFSMIFVDIVEKLRPYRLMGKNDDLDNDMILSSPTLTNLEPVTSVSGQLPSEPVQDEDTPNGVAHPEPAVRNGAPSGRWQDSTPTRPTYTSSRINSTAYLYSSRPRAYSGPLKILWRQDPRAEIFVESFMFWLDTVEMVRTGEKVFSNMWVFPVYIFSFLSCLRLAITPNNPLHSWAGVMLQDFPFFVLRVALLSKFGFVTPLLFVMKNLLVCLTYVYFTFLTKLKIFNRQNIF